MSPAKHLLFTQYGWYALVVAVAAVVLSVAGAIKPEALAAILAAALSFVYFVQKQKLEETTLFRILFDSFNHRYDLMNEKLNRIILEKTSDDLSIEDRLMLYDYFNLCAEEYLYFKQGYILPEAWESWFNGMRFYYRNERIRRLWDEELKTNSYYGLTLN